MIDRRRVQDCVDAVKHALQVSPLHQRFHNVTRTMRIGWLLRDVRPLGSDQPHVPQRAIQGRRAGGPETGADDQTAMGRIHTRRRFRNAFKKKPREETLGCETTESLRGPRATEAFKQPAREPRRQFGIKRGACRMQAIRGIHEFRIR